MSSNNIIEQQPLAEFPLWHKSPGKQRPLFGFELELTARCNLNCRHCYINLPANDENALKNELSFKEIKRLAQSAVDLGALWCLITGGEPLIRKDFEDLYIMLKRKGLLVSVFTNATFIKDHHVRLFKKYPPRNIEVTVYGTTEKTYTQLCRTSRAFNAFQSGLNRLLDAGLPVTLKTMTLRSNVHELPEITKFCRSKSSTAFRHDPFLHLRLDKNPHRNKEIIKERLSSKEIVSLEANDKGRMTALNNVCRLSAVGMSPKAGQGLFRCRAGLEEATIGWNGKFRLCNSLTHPNCVADLRKISLEKAWREFVPKVRKLSAITPSYLQTCGGCDIINACMWCPAHAFLETGSLEAHVPYFCEIAKERVRQAKEVNE